MQEKVLKLESKKPCIEVAEETVWIPDVAVWPRVGYVLPLEQVLKILYPYANPTFVVEVATSQSINEVDARARRFLSNHAKVQLVLVIKV